MPRRTPSPKQLLIGGGSEDVQAHRRTRRTDPETSRWAAESLKNCSKLQNVILGVLNGSPKGLSDDRIVAHVRRFHGEHSESSIRSRRAELVALNLVKWNGKHTVMPSGRKARLWVRVK